MESQLRREMRKIRRNLEGIRNMSKLPGCIVVIDVKREANALAEARKLGIPTICLIDTDGDPDMADIAIPGNDDSMRSIDVVVRELCAAVTEGKQLRATKSGDREEMAGAEGRPSDAPAGRRSRRAQYSADEAGTPPTADSNDAEVSVAAASDS
ncbi:MAG: 30S ribosomal protein S2, partial [Phycisphaerales bacterium]|nr:30S ribosomal protein S2 [Phycisphaerales bacterium]